MTTASNQVSSPNWNVLPQLPPGQEVTCAFWQSSTVRRVTNVATFLATGVFYAGYRWAYTNFTAHYLTVIRTVNTLQCLTIASGVSTVALLLLPTSSNDPTWRVKQRQKAGPDIEGTGGKMLAIETIQARYQHLFNKGILVHADIDALVTKELASPKFDFEEFMNRHTDNQAQVLLSYLTPTTKQALIAKFLQLRFHSDVTVKTLSALPWVKALGITPAALAEVLFRNEERLQTIQEDRYDYSTFIQNYGVECIAVLPDALRKNLGNKFIGMVLAQNLTLERAKDRYHAFAVDHFNYGQVLLTSVAEQQFQQMRKGLVEDYEAYRDGNSFAFLKHNAEQYSDFKEKAKACFLKMNKKMFDDKFKEDYALFGITAEDCIDIVVEYANTHSYSDFKKTYGFAHFGKVVRYTQLRFYKEIAQLIFNNPVSVDSFADELNDQITRMAVKGHLLRLCANTSFPTLFKQGLILFKKKLFLPDDVAGEKSPTFEARLQAEITDYATLLSYSKTYGEGFFTSGLISELHVKKILAKHLKLNADTFLMQDVEPQFEVQDAEVTKALFEARGQFQAERRRAKAEIERLQEILNNDLRLIGENFDLHLKNSTLKKDYSATQSNLEDSRRALAQKQKELATAQSELKAKRERLSAVPTEIPKLEEEARALYRKLQPEKFDSTKLEEEAARLSSMIPSFKPIDPKDKGLLEAREQVRIAESNLEQYHTLMTEISALGKQLDNPEWLQDHSKPLKGEAATIAAEIVGREKVLKEMGELRSLEFWLQARNERVEEILRLSEMAAKQGQQLQARLDEIKGQLEIFNKQKQLWVHIETLRKERAAIPQEIARFQASLSDLEKKVKEASEQVDASNKTNTRARLKVEEEELHLRRDKEDQEIAKKTEWNNQKQKIERDSNKEQINIIAAFKKNMDTI